MSTSRDGGCHLCGLAVWGSATNYGHAPTDVEPLGNVPAAAKYATNATLLATVLLLVPLAARAQRAHASMESAR